MSNKVAGYIFYDGIETGETVKCCHCDGHFIRRPGSGKVRGFCMRCEALTCGKPECNPCVPFEKRLELYQKGLLPSL